MDCNKTSDYGAKQLSQVFNQDLTLINLDMRKNSIGDEGLYEIA